MEQNQQSNLTVKRIETVMKKVAVLLIAISLVIVVAMPMSTSAQENKPVMSWTVLSSGPPILALRFVPRSTVVMFRHTKRLSVPPSLLAQPVLSRARRIRER
jgi:O-antigen/teichoic acid export membrane protein